MKYILMPKYKRSMAAGGKKKAEEKEMIGLKQFGSFPIPEPRNSVENRLRSSLPYRTRRAANQSSACSCSQVLSARVRDVGEHIELA